MKSKSLYVVASSTWLVSATALVTALIRGKVSAVYLEADGVGLIGQLNSLSLLGGSIAVLGVGTAAIQLIARARARGDVSDAQALATFTIAGPVLVSLALTAAAVVASPLIAAALVGDSGRWPEVSIALCSVPLNVFVGCVSIVLQAHGQAVRSATNSLMALPANTLLVVSLVIWAGLSGAVWGVLLTSVVPALILLAREHRIVRGAFGLPRLPATLRRDVWKLGAASFVLGTASSLLDSAMRGFLIHSSSVAIAGEYQVLSVASSQAFLQASNGVMVYLGPGLAAAIVLGRTQAREELNRALKFLLAFTIFGAWICAAFAEPLVVTLFSQDFVGASRALRLQAGGEILRATAYVLGATLLPLGMKRAWLGIGLTTLLIQGFSVASLVGSLGLLAVPMGFTLAWFFNAATTYILAWRRGLSPRTTSTVVALVCTLAIVLLGSVSPPPAWLVAAAGVVCALATVMLVRSPDRTQRPLVQRKESV